MQEAARSPYNSYLSDGDDSFVPYPYNPRANDYVTHEDPRRRKISERERQLELVRQIELTKRREDERVRELEEHASRRYEVSLVPSS